MRPNPSSLRSLSMSCVRHGLYCALGLLSYAAALGDEVTVRNDSFESGQSAYVVGDFVPGEHAGAVLTAPCDGAIVAVQIGWLAGSQTDPSVERAIHVYADAGQFPTPGDELLYLEAPLLTPGFLNEFRYVDEGNQTPIDIPVSAGQKFYVTLEFENPTDVGHGGASVFRDINGCQSGKNVLFAIPGGWLDFCIYLSGDLVIRAVIDCGAGQATGACCLPNGSCQVKTQSDCNAAGGTYQGDNVSCGNVQCPQPVGACCLPDGSCLEMTAADCSAALGVYQGDGLACGSVQCPIPTGACCFPATGGCLNNFTQSDCQNAAGVWKGPNSNCGDIICFPKGACCLPDGGCLDQVSPEECAAAGGTFQGDATTCGGVSCPLPTGACCFGTGFCLTLTQDECGIAGGAWAGAGTDCADSNGNGTSDVCEPTQCDPCDTNCDGSVNAQDIQPFIEALSGNNPPMCSPCVFDMNGDGSINATDIQPFRECLQQP